MAVDRSRLPALGPDPGFTFPDIRRRRLANGLGVWTVEHRDVPVVNALFVLPVGAGDDPIGRPGVAAITGDMLDEGSGDRSALELHESLGQIGATLETEIGSDATMLGLTVLGRFAGRGFELLSDIVTRPRFEPREFDRVREQRLNRLVQMRDLPSSVAERVFVQLLYGQHPYGHQAIGTEPSLRTFTVEDAVRFHAQWYDPSFATLIVTGDGTHDELAALAEQAFGSWKHDAGRKSTERPPASPPIPADRLALVHRPGAAQSEIRIGHVSLPRNNPDYHALLTLNMILGGQFVSRINMNLREDKGYTYGVRTAFELRRGPGPFVLSASVQSDATVDALREAIGEMAAIRGARPITREELLLGRAALTRGYPRNFETGDQIARAAAQLALYGLPDDYFSTFVPRVLALTEADITRAAAAHIHPDRLLLVVVGDRDTFGAKIGELGMGSGIDVDPAADLQGRASAA